MLDYVTTYRCENVVSVFGKYFVFDDVVYSNKSAVSMMMWFTVLEVQNSVGSTEAELNYTYLT
jgi:hypothetical protein